jgi:hypothetical protein
MSSASEEVIRGLEGVLACGSSVAQSTATSLSCPYRGFSS